MSRLVSLLKLDMLVTLGLVVFTYPSLLWCLLVVTVIHEAGHALAARSLGLESWVCLSTRGVRVLVETQTATQGLLVALAGPLASLLSAGAFLQIGEFKLGVCSLCAGVLMLAPVRPLDGWLALSFYRQDHQ